MNWRSVVVNQLLDCIDERLIDENTISMFSYNHLMALLEMTQEIEGGAHFFVRIKSYLENLNIRRLKEQDKIIVGFMVNFSSTWIGEELYQLFEQSEKFEPYVFVLANHNGQSFEFMMREYEDNLNYFLNKGMRVLGTVNYDSGNQRSWQELGVKPEVCIWLSSWVEMFTEHFNLLNFSLDVLHTYIPYAYMLLENVNNNFVYSEFNKIIHNLSWLNFENSMGAMRLADKYAFVGSTNAVYSGYPKMDIYAKIKRGKCSVWDRLLEKNKTPNAKKIIWAPHQTLEKNEPILFSTFAFNYLLFLEFAQKYSENIVWVIKPHPLLKLKAIKCGLFKDEKEWDEYILKWNSLSNAEVFWGGDYHEVFLNSDAMIMDSGSFLAEYVFSNKPLLFLQRDEQRFNDAGREIMEFCYKAHGSDRIKIEEFIEMILKGEDSLKEKREEYFLANLDYYQISGKNASSNIYDLFDSTFV